jgi:hypothetical protein
LVLVVVAASCLTYHLSMRSMPLLPYCLTILPMDRSPHRLDGFTTTVAVAVSQFAGLIQSC